MKCEAEIPANSKQMKKYHRGKPRPVRHYKANALTHTYNKEIISPLSILESRLTKKIGN
jgi:hypothetical protein